MRMCDIEQCGRKHYSRGFCHRHYKRDEVVRKGHPFFNENRIVSLDNSIEIVLEDRKRKETARVKIDSSDLDMIRSFKWCLTDGGYAITNHYGTMIRMHVMIMGFVGVDHINRDRLDNRRSNLRKATYTDNQRNSNRSSNSTGFKGIVARNGRYRPRIKYGGKEHYLGSYETPEEAAYVYDQVAIQLFKEFACTNFLYAH